ncbi:MAG: aminotransferase class IV [Candidatus Competibacteraceae bacterium]|nr:aminotransferase class IV [Candidatus Competibacteraceae bacterium]
MRVEQGQVLGWPEHFGRLALGARTLEIPFNLSADELLVWCHQVLDANQMEEARMRITLTRGPIRNHPAQPLEGEPTILLTATALDSKITEMRSRGWNVMLAPHPKNHRSPVARIKSTSYVESLLARRAAQRKGFDEALILNVDGAVAEGSVSNLFLFDPPQRAGGRWMLSTPRLEDGALAGTMPRACFCGSPRS